MKILILLSRFPYPLEKGDKLRAYHQLRLLSEKHEIILCALSKKKVREEDFNHIKQFCSSLHIFYFSKWNIIVNLFKVLFSKIPFQVAYFHHSFIQQKIDEIILKEKPEHIYCQLIRMAEYVKNTTSIPKTLDYMDAFSIGMKRRENNSSVYLKPFFSIERIRLKNYEMDVFNYFENKTIISEQDKNFIKHPEQEEIKVIPNGIDTEYFSPRKSDKEYDLLFSGNMNYYPNIEAALFIEEKIFPALLQNFPSMKLLIAGASPSARILKLKSKSITVSGWMEDIREAYWKSKIFVAPIFHGSGMQNKVLEAMAMGLPCVTTVMVNNAINAPKDCILLAETAGEFERQIILLMKDKNLSESISANALNFVKQNYNWRIFVEDLEKTFLTAKTQRRKEKTKN